LKKHLQEPKSGNESDIAAYLGLKNGAQAVEIGMAEIVSGNPLSVHYG
jgi:hypothetical protein